MALVSFVMTDEMKNLLTISTSKLAARPVSAAGDAMNVALGAMTGAIAAVNTTERGMEVRTQAVGGSQPEQNTSVTR